MENAFEKYKPELLVPACAFLSLEENIRMMRKVCDNRACMERQLALAYKQSHEVFEDYKKRLEGS